MKKKKEKRFQNILNKRLLNIVTLSSLNNIRRFSGISE